MPEVEALLLERRMRCASEDAFDQAWLVAELRHRFGLSLEELARRLDRNKSRVSRRLALIQGLTDHDSTMFSGHEVFTSRPLRSTAILGWPIKSSEFNSPNTSRPIWARLHDTVMRSSRSRRCPNGTRSWDCNLKI
jgi:hypothetical protein